MSTCRWSDTKHIASDKNKIKFNKMKKLFFLILTIAFSSFYAKSQIVKIAEINSNGTISFVVSTQTLLDNWNHNLNESSGINADLTSIIIQKDANDIYYAVARGNEYRSATIVYADGNEIFSYKANIDYTITCTSKTCASEPKCLPKDGGICAPPCDDCTKTTTIGKGIMSY